MPKFNPEDYAPVEERIALFYADHAEGRILTGVERLDPPLVVFRAEVYRDAADERPWATGYAYEKEGEGHVNRTSYIENCETSAIGRALANAGYHGKREGAPRPSREEMQKVERMGGQPAGGPPAPQPASGDVPPCPSCGNQMWDNRTDEKAGVNGGKRPDLKCKDKECDTAIWLDGLAKDVRAMTEQAVQADVISPEDAATTIRVAVDTLHPAKLVEAKHALEQRMLEAQGAA